MEEKHEIEPESNTYVRYTQIKKQISRIRTEELQKLKERQKNTPIDQKTICKRMKCFPARELISIIPDISESSKHQMEAKIKQIENCLYAIDPSECFYPTSVSALAYYIIFNKSQVESTKVFKSSTGALYRLINYIRQNHPSDLTKIMKERTNMIQNRIQERRQKKINKIERRKKAILWLHILCHQKALSRLTDKDRQQAQLRLEYERTTFNKLYPNNNSYKKLKKL